MLAIAKLIAVVYGDFVTGDQCEHGEYGLEI